MNKKKVGPKEKAEHLKRRRMHMLLAPISYAQVKDMAQEFDLSEGRVIDMLVEDYNKHNPSQSQEK